VAACRSVAECLYVERFTCRLLERSGRSSVWSRDESPSFYGPFRPSFAPGLHLPFGLTRRSVVQV
jgi:hypothetical protein